MQGEDLNESATVKADFLFSVYAGINRTVLLYEKNLGNADPGSFA